MYTDTPVLAELRSSAISIPDNGACLSFEYLLSGSDNILHVIIKRLDGTIDSQSLFTTETETKYYTIKRITLKGNQDIDIGFIGMATNGKTAIKGISITEGNCYYWG